MRRDSKKVKVMQFSTHTKHTILSDNNEEKKSFEIEFAWLLKKYSYDDTVIR